MKLIIELLAKDASFLYEKYGYRIIDSYYDPAFGGCGHVTITNDRLQINFWVDRDQVMMDFRPIELEKAETWFSDEIICELLGIDIDDSPIRKSIDTLFGEPRNGFNLTSINKMHRLRKKIVREVLQNISKVEELFSPGHFNQTKERYAEILNRRSEKYS